MKRSLSSSTLTALVAAAAIAALCGTAACSGDDDDGAATSIDPTNGKAISDLDIGGDRTLGKGDSEQATATVRYADGTNADVTTNPALVWNVDNTSVATISRAGVHESAFARRRARSP